MLKSGPGFVKRSRSVSGGIEPVRPYFDAVKAISAAHNYSTAEYIFFCGIKKEDAILYFQEFIWFGLIEAEYPADLAEWGFENFDRLLKI